MPTWPVQLDTWLAPFRVSGQTFSLGEGKSVQNRTAGGEVLNAGGAARLWRGTLQFWRMRADDAGAFEARLNALASPGASFWVRDYRRAPGAVTGAVLNFNATTRDIVTLKGLPAGHVINAGDYIAFDYSGRRAFHQVLSRVVASGTGTTGNIDIVPPFRTGMATDLPVYVGSPSLRAVMVPGSLRPAEASRIWSDGASFEWTQTLRENP